MLAEKNGHSIYLRAIVFHEEALGLIPNTD